MKFSVLASGSRGNCTVVETSDRCLLVDVGLGPRILARQLSGLNRTTDQITDLFITHEHSDHISGIEQFCKRNADARIYATKGTSRRLPETVQGRVTIVQPGRAVPLGQTLVLPLHVSHDAAEPVGYRIQNGDGSLAMVTDLGRFDERLLGELEGLSALVIEANHDRDMLAQGPYPYRLKSRIAGPKGHLSNAQCADLVSHLAARSSLFDVTLAHISETNNSSHHLAILGQRLRMKGIDTVRIAPRRAVAQFVALSQPTFNMGEGTQKTHQSERMPKRRLQS